MIRINERTWVPIAMAIVLLLFAGMAMPVAAEEMQAEDEVFSIGGYDLGLFPFDTEAGVSDGIDPEIAAMPYRLVNPDYIPEEFVILRTGGEFSAEDLEADCELLGKKWKFLCGNYVRNRPIGYGMPVLNGTETLSAYGVAIRPDGVCEQYFGYGSPEGLTPAKKTGGVKSVAIGDTPSTEARAQTWKNEITQELSGFTLANSQPYLIGIQTLDRYVTKNTGHEDDFGYVKIKTYYYWDNLENDPENDYFFAKTILMTKPGSLIWNNLYHLDHFRLDQNWKYFTGVQRGLNPLPGVDYSECKPTTTVGYSSISVSLSPATATLGWNTQIPDQRVEDIGSPRTARASWNVIFNPEAYCSKNKFEFTGASAVSCNQKSFRGGSTYGLCSVTVDFTKGWSRARSFVPFTSRDYGPYCGTTSMSHIYAVRWR